MSRNRRYTRTSERARECVKENPSYDIGRVTTAVVFKNYLLTCDLAILDKGQQSEVALIDPANGMVAFCGHTIFAGFADRTIDRRHWGAA
jgi:hypothetical protein